MSGTKHLRQIQTLHHTTWTGHGEIVPVQFQQHLLNARGGPLQAIHAETKGCCGANAGEGSSKLIRDRFELDCDYERRVKTNA